MNRIGIDLGGTKIEGVVLDSGARVVSRTRIATESDGGYEHILARIAHVIDQLRPHAPDSTSIGIGTPGSVSSRDGTLKNSNTACLNGRRLREDLAERLGLEVHIENDANCFALAEARAGAGREAELVFGVIMGTGVGGGLVWRGGIWRGPQHLGGEWGHHRVDPLGPSCYCGHRGCVESFLSGPAVERRYAEKSGERRGTAEIATRARAGEPVADEVFREFLDRFGLCLANVINIVDPNRIVLGGGLSHLDELYDEGREAVRRYVFNDELTTPIVRNRLGDSAGVIGAAFLVGS